MKLMQQIGARRFAPGKGVEQSSPQKGPKRFFFLIHTYFWNLIGMNLLFLLCCVPLVTIPASLCALNRYLIKMVNDGVGFSMADYWQEWKRQLLKSLPAGLVCALPLSYGYYLLSMSAGEHGSSIVFSFGVLWTMVGLTFGAYVFILLAMLDLPLRFLMKNALILIICEWKSSLYVLVATMLTLVAGLILFPYSVAVLVVCWFALLQLALCCIINEPVQKRIINPYKKKQKMERETESAKETSEISNDNAYPQGMGG
jgi:hypothetical protein